MARTAVLSENEVSTLARQMTLDEVFNDLLYVEIEQSELDARKGRDEQILVFMMARTPEIVGATSNTRQDPASGNTLTDYTLSHNDYTLTAKQSVSSERVNHAQVYTALDERHTYFASMAEQMKGFADSAETEEVRQRYMDEHRRYTACEAALQEILDVKSQATSGGGIGDYSLKIVANKPKKASSSSRRRKSSGN